MADEIPATPVSDPAATPVGAPVEDGKSLLGAVGDPSPDPPAGEEKPPEGEDDKKPEPKAPEEYADFNVPEGMTLDEATTTDFKALAKEMDLTQDQAQKLLEFGGGKLKEQIEAPYQLWRDTQAQWQKEVKADPEIGGSNFENSVKAAAEVFKPGPGNPLVKTPEDAQGLRDALNSTGAGNNPAIVKFFVRLGGLITEPGSFNGKPVTQKGDMLKNLYPTMQTGE